MKPFSIQRLLADRGLTPEERREVLEDLFVFGKKNQASYLFRMSILLVLSTVIATSGLLSDSAAVVIGAMLVAPLMNPVMATAGAVVMGWPDRFYRALWLVALMALGALLLSSFLTFASPEVIFIPEQVMARTRPTYYDLLIALAAGSAGAYTITRKETSAIPGVAVAVALLPPLASAGILLTIGESELALRALVLFLVNFFAMVLAGALTFLVVGVSPATARKRSSAFARNQILLFFLLTTAVSVPLWYYSERIIFNAQYRAAKSEILQNWLQENDLELRDVDILRERRTLYLSLAGPAPPVNIGELHERLANALALNGDDWSNFKIRYTWTQKVVGVWPQPRHSMEEIAERAQIKGAQLTANPWTWEATQYHAGSSAQPASGEYYTLIFKQNGDLEVSGQCGRWEGMYTFGSKSMDLEIGENLNSGCEDNAVVEIFLEDLDRARAAYIDGGRLKITLAHGEGIIYFRKD
jgi:uncharacterized hydrophobic protein (TIGR00271 family)